MLRTGGTFLVISYGAPENRLDTWQRLQEVQVPEQMEVHKKDLIAGFGGRSAMETQRHIGYLEI